MLTTKQELLIYKAIVKKLDRAIILSDYNFIECMNVVGDLEVIVELDPNKKLHPDEHFVMVCKVDGNNVTVIN
jgi:hypothetical protein